MSAWLSERRDVERRVPLIKGCRGDRIADSTGCTARSAAGVLLLVRLPFQARIPAIMSAHSGHRDHRFRASRSLIGAKRRRQRLSGASRWSFVTSSYVSFLVRRLEMAGGPLWAARSVRRPSRCGNRVLGDFHAGGTVHGLRRSRRQDGSRAIASDRDHDDGAFRSRGASPGSRIVGPFSVSRCARWITRSQIASATDWARQWPRATRSAAAGWR